SRGCAVITMVASAFVLVVASPPDARLVPALGCAVEPLVHAPDPVHTARISGIGVVDDTVLEHERAHARPFAMERGRIGPAKGRELRLGLRAATLRTRARLAPVVVFDAFALLLLGERGGEVEVEIARRRGRPRKRPTQPPPVRQQLLER